MAARWSPALDQLIASGNTVENRARLVELMSQTAGCDGRRLRTRRNARRHPRGDAQVRRQRSRAARPELASHQQLHPLRDHRPDGGARRLQPDAAGRVSAAWGSARSPCASSPRNCRAAISASARSARARRSRPNSFSTAAPRNRSGNGCPRSRPAKFFRPQCSPSRIPAPISPRCKTRAARIGDQYVVHGNKTWITHPVRADLMTLLVRTNSKEPGHRGLSMLLAEKPRGTDARPISGTWNVRHRDRGARLSRHEGIRDRVRRV